MGHLIALLCLANGVLTLLLIPRTLRMLFLQLSDSTSPRLETNVFRPGLTMFFVFPQNFAGGRRRGRGAENGRLLNVGR